MSRVAALERLATSVDVAVLVTGDSGGVDQLSQRMLRISEVWADAAQALGQVEMTWQGDARTSFDAEFELEPVKFRRAAEAFDTAGYALGSYAIALDSARASAVKAATVYQRGVWAKTKADPLGVQSTLATTGAPGAPLQGASLTPAPGLADQLAGAEMLDAAWIALRAAAAKAATSLRDAITLAPEQISAGQHLLNFVDPLGGLDEKKNFWAGGVRGVVDMGLGSSPVGMWFSPMIAKPLDDAEWALGLEPHAGWHTGGSVVLPMVATLGEGTAETLALKGVNTAVTRLGASTGRLLGRGATEEATTLAGTANKPGAGRLIEELTCEGDPVDVATGHVLLTQTDVSLPGGLPLVLSRTYNSGFRWGSAFGRRWGSTLDERLVPVEDGLVLVRADAGLTHYPVPPVDGSRSSRPHHPLPAPARGR